MLEKFSTEKRKQFFYMTGAVAGVMAVIFVLSSVFKEDKPEKQIKAPEFKVIKKDDLDAKTFRKEYGDELAAIKGELKEMQKKMEEEKQKKEATQVPPASQDAGNAVPPATQASQILVPPPPPSSLQASGEMPSPPPPTKPVEPKVIPMQDLIVLTSFQPAEATKTEEKKENTKVEIPSGSFTKGVLLSGLDAPTGGKAKSSPHPVLIRITDTTIMPNRARANIRECFVIGEAFGDLSSERAYIRTSKLSCVTNSGKTIEKSISGYVAGEDGKAGMIGRVVSKQGAMLARTLAAGFLEGVANAFNQGNTTYSIQPTGTIGTPDPNKVGQMAMFSGAAEASKKLADFYMKMTNEMFPVIEINAGRKMDVIFLERVTFDYEEEK